MKKNILLVPSLLLLPLLTPSALFASEKNIKGRAAAKKAKKQLNSSKGMPRSASQESLMTALQPEVMEQQPEANLSQHILDGIQDQLRAIAEPVVFASTQNPEQRTEDTQRAQICHQTEDVQAQVDTYLDILLKTPEARLHNSVVIKEEVTIPFVATNEQLTLLHLVETKEIPLTATDAEGKELGYIYSAMEVKANSVAKINAGEYELHRVEAGQPAQDAAPELMPRKNKIPTWDVIATNFNEVLAQLVTVVKTGAIKKNANTVNALEMSIYEPAPTIKQGFVSWTEALKNKWNPKWFVVDAIKDGSFDPENDSHMNALMVAAEKLVFDEKSVELKDLLDACRANPRYSNIELDEKTALKIQKRFALDLQSAVEAPNKIEASAHEKLMIAHKAILELSRDQIDAFEKQLAKNREELAKAEIEYAIATTNTLELQNKKAQQTIDGMEVLHKLYRKLPTSDAIKLDRHSYAYLPVKANIDKQIETALVGMNYSLNNLDSIHYTIKGTLQMLPAKKEAVAQIANK